MDGKESEDKEILPLDWVKVGSRIQKFRKERNMTQYELMVAVDYETPVSISYFEHGKLHPSIEKMVKMANLLSVSVGELLEDFPEEGRPAFAGEFMNAVKDCDDYEVRMLSYLLKDLKKRLREKEALEERNSRHKDDGV